MTVSFLALTDTDETRSALGVDTTDITDEGICDMHPEDDLEADLLGWLPTYQSVIIAEGLSASPTTEQRLKFLKLKIYAKYFIAVIVVTSGINSILQKASDGSNEGIRFTNITLKDLKNDLIEARDSAKSELELLVTPTLETSYSHFGSASPTYDPVTNE